MQRQLLRAEVFCDGGAVVITNMNDSVWPSGKAFLNSTGSGYEASFAGIDPGDQFHLPISDFNEHRHAKSISELPVDEVVVEADGFETRTFKIRTFEYRP